MAVDNSTADTGTDPAGGYAWLADLPGDLAAQRRVMSGLLGWSAATTLVTSLSVGCSLGRGAADALSDIDAALGLGCESGAGGAGQRASGARQREQRNEPGQDRADHRRRSAGAKPPRARAVSGNAHPLLKGGPTVAWHGSQTRSCGPKAARSWSSPRRGGVLAVGRRVSPS